MNKLNLLKLVRPILLTPLALLLFMLPVGAISGSDIKLSSNGAGGPDIDISSDGTRLAVAYYKQDSTSGAGAIYLKSATANGLGGWVTSAFVGFGSNPQVAFKRGVTNVVYVVWVNNNNTAIQSARCTLNPTTAPTCVVGNNVRTIGVSNLAAPDIVVDGSNFLHVAWQNGDGIETARATASDSVTAWPATLGSPGLCSGSKAAEPVLGWSTGNKMHLAFLCGSSSSPQTSIEYRRSLNNLAVPINWNDKLEDFVRSFEISTVHTKLGNVALHASGSQVSLAWDGLRSGQEFGLMYVASINEGTNWGTAAYVPSPSPGTAASGNPGGQNKLSTTSTLPPQEFGLRPSLVISGTAGNAAVVWQQKLNLGDCQDGVNGSSEVHFINPQFTNTAPETLEHTNNIVYSIDPDLAVGPGGVRHFVFMKDNAAVNCTGGVAASYAIYYRGPFTNQTNDHGEETAGGIFLPIILR